VRSLAFQELDKQGFKVQCNWWAKFKMMGSQEKLVLVWISTRNVKTISAGQLEGFILLCCILTDQLKIRHH
jgi:hypothetical protein